MNSERYKSIDRKIKETEEQITLIAKAFSTDSLDYMILNEQLNKRLENLKYQKQILVDAYLKESVKLIISGENVKKGKISSRVLVAVLDGFQSIADSIANSLINEPTSSGKIPANVLKQTDLELVNIFEGSFGVELESNIEDNLMVDNAVITETLDKLFNLLSSADDNDKVFDEISELGSRTLNHYKTWLKDISEYGVEVQLERKNQYAENYSWKMKRDKLPSLLNSLDNLKDEFTEELEIVGKITGLNLRKETFEFICNTEEVISGRGKYEIIENNKHLLGETVKLKLIKNVTRNLSTGREKIIWFLKDIISEK
ncbi:hypothetical protein [Clostridium guangxiense]|uniref:hypothetical protein n=1 Tax=Clostridium guangxiense TaxID=1662055 RepID=UPI001E5F6567|nr:hypothetical protein [Clostridium guangxiense]MCD2347418.1 hypothetical protein [Clostridium guangxiense]